MTRPAGSRLGIGGLRVCAADIAYGAESPSPKKRRSKASNKSSNVKNVLNMKSPSKGKVLKEQVRTPSPNTQSETSPLTAPKTPKSASKLGIPPDTVKTMSKYASKINPLVRMIYTVTQYFIETKEDIPSREDFLPKLVDCVHSLVTLSSSFNIYY